MDRKIVLNARANDVLDWLYAWCHEKFSLEDYKKFSTPSILRNFLIENHYVSDFQERIQKLIPEDLIISSDSIAESLSQKLLFENILLVGEFSDLRVNEKRLILLVDARYSLVLASRPPQVCQEKVHIYLFKCHRVGRFRTLLQVTCAVPEVEWILDDLWHDLSFVFQVETNPSMTDSAKITNGATQPPQASDQGIPHNSRRGPKTGMIQLGTIQKLERLREIREEAIRNHRHLPTKEAALYLAGLSYKTLQRHDPMLLAKWDDVSYRPGKRLNLE